MFYLTKTPKWAFKLFNKSVWQMPDMGKNIFLTFDDGPHSEITPFVLNELDKFDAKATFFCIGKNVLENPLVFNQIIDKGHAVGNHTFSHLDGWKAKNTDYRTDILKAREYIDSDLFRPPYGRITRKQHKELTMMERPFRIIMWSVLSGDFHVKLSPEECCENVISNVKSGSVVVFHDSEKANERLRYALPIVLKHFNEQGYLFRKIELS